jgi:hypothetical protein
VNKTDKLCETFLQNGLLSMLANDVAFPTTLCHSPEDDLVPYSMLPTLPLATNPNFVKPYVAAFPELVPTGSHGVAYFFCLFGPLTNLALSGMSGGGATNPDSPNYIIFLDGDTTDEDNTTITCREDPTVPNPKTMPPTSPPIATSATLRISAMSGMVAITTAINILSILPLFLS